MEVQDLPPLTRPIPEIPEMEAVASQTDETLDFPLLGTSTACGAGPGVSRAAVGLEDVHGVVSDEVHAARRPDHTESFLSADVKKDGTILKEACYKPMPSANPNPNPNPMGGMQSRQEGRIPSCTWANRPGIPEAGAS